MSFEVICGDSNIILKHLPTGDLLLADPPFDEWNQFLEVIANRQDRTLAVFTTWQHRIPIEQRLGKPKAEIIWHFGDGRWVSHNLPRLTHSSILIYGEVGDAYVGEYTPNQKPINKGYGSVGKDKLGERMYTPRNRKLLNSVIVAPRNVSNGVWAKPAAVVRPLIEWLCPVGGLVIDPFMGRGTALISARALKRNYIGIDIDPDCVANAEHQTESELELFPDNDPTLLWNIFGEEIRHEHT